ncbi:MAG: ABC transporter ATP-binding protein [Clostridia bacterium]|nr:ABC transporter ATP-binding protein [Clostridia bacterium]
MIEIKGVGKNFGEIRSLDHIDMTVPDGSIYGLIGSNGSGKSTLLRVMNGVFSPDEGSVTYDGISVWENHAIKRGIVYLSDEQYFLPASSLAEMRALYASFYPDFDVAAYGRYCGLFGLDDRRRLSTFSKGMKKQAAVVLALASRPRYLLCDETFDGLDPVMRQLFKRLLAEAVAERGMTVVIASHNLSEIEDICDHIALLHKAKLVFSREIDDLKQQIHTVQAVFSEHLEANRLGLDVVRCTQRGGMVTLLVRGEREAVERAVVDAGAKFCELIPLTLEEIFISEMEERGYDYNSLL